MCNATIGTQPQQLATGPAKLYKTKEPGARLDLLSQAMAKLSFLQAERGACLFVCLFDCPKPTA
eukprot:CAMPEP_0206581754 /NCGR_PEP_ID=MMETSP0325_2-20121206/34037_1 /ASSEMBLY_ACC=CAM_ASM_000347 /TAXON_ID=2866 /ORGANISM="Crypthecodinium cohnii, Strain Seligo" /LENGTH=63 /DNA_ID=CAMNT_0054088225 /DNA_START=73 /DNA_END=260 /DNA_ORIENTATION=+